MTDLTVRLLSPSSSGNLSLGEAPNSTRATLKLSPRKAILLVASRRNRLMARNSVALLYREESTIKTTSALELQAV